MNTGMTHAGLRACRAVEREGSRLARARARIFVPSLVAAVLSAAPACVVAPPAGSNANAPPSASPSQTTSLAPPDVSASPSPTPTGPQTPAPTPPPSAPTPDAAPAAEIPVGSLVIPVAGVRVEDLRDTYSEARSEGRTHNSIDIPAPKGTPVLAAADGTIVKLFWNDKGGTTIYQRGTDGRTIYYYAHLDRYADGLSENKQVRRGELIAYVGDTGNATPGNYHLHFSIWITEDPKRYWDGVSLNPYPLLVGKR